MTSRSNIRSRLSSQKDGGGGGGGERFGWRTSSANREEDQTFQRSTYRSEMLAEISPIGSSHYEPHTSAENPIDPWEFKNVQIHETPRASKWRSSFMSDFKTREESNPTELFSDNSESFARYKSERDSFSQEDNERSNGSIFESRRFQSLRWKKQRDLDLLSERYKQNQEDWKKYVPKFSNNHIAENGNVNGFYQKSSKETGSEINETQNSIENNHEVYSFPYCPKRTKPHEEITEESIPQQPNTTREHTKQYLDESSQICETHFDTKHNNDDDDDNNDFNNISSDISSPRSSRNQKSWIQQHDSDNIDFNRQTSNTINNDHTKSHLEGDDRSLYDESSFNLDSFRRGNSKRSSKQQIGFRGTVQGLLARIGKKVSKNDTTKLTRDEKIIAIMLQKKEEEERKEREREEAHTRWEQERINLMRNATDRRSMDPGVFRRRNSLGGSVSGMRRETSKSRNVDKLTEKKRRNELQEEEHKQQLQAKMENDFQRANSLRASISQQNLLKTKLKNLQMEQKYQQISLQKRKSMENLSQLKKQIECKHILVEQKLENMRREQRKSRDDLRFKADNSKMRIQLLNDELAQYQTDLQEFNEKQIQHADYLVKRTQAERMESARRERLEKERNLVENKRRLQEDEQKRLMEVEQQLMVKEKKREELIKEKLELQAKSRASARASQLLREEIRNCDDLTLTAKRLAAFQERSFTSKRSSDTDSLNSAITSPTHLNYTQRTKM